jgi:hypothetical protein
MLDDAGGGNVAGLLYGPRVGGREIGQFLAFLVPNDEVVVEMKKVARHFLEKSPLAITFPNLDAG